MSSFGLQLLAGPRKHRARSKSSSTWRRRKEARIRRIASLKFQLADAQTAAGEFDRALALLRDAKQALASVVAPGHCRTGNHPFPDRRLAASRRCTRLRVGDSRRDRRVTCARAAPAGSSAKPAPEKIPNTSRCGGTMRAPGVDPEEFLLRRSSSRFERPPRLRLERQGPAG
jgi:hypothetical protein